RVAVLNGADGVVFVADSNKSKMQENVNSLKELAQNITRQNKRFAEFPIVMQYNKRDLPKEVVAPVQTMDHFLGVTRMHWPRIEAVATVGTGVFETLRAISRAVISKL
ncbi:MAG: gliding-motility protein MglA, partial [Chloroflexia bacterium]|nr:gliding-motility protein MglA [Chloroflexia bacterium]